MASELNQIVRSPRRTSARSEVDQLRTRYLVFGPAAHIPLSNEYYYQAQSTDNLFPAGEQVDDPYPILRRYYDIYELVHMSEFTITDLAITTAAFGFFSIPGEATRLRRR